MGLLKTVIIGAAIYGAYKFLTEPDDFGRTKLDTIKEEAPEWLERAKEVNDDLRSGHIPEGI